MRYLSIGLEHGSIIVEIEVCQRCFSRSARWWNSQLWQHPLSGKVHKVSGWKDGRTECGVRFPANTRIADTHIAVAVT